MTFTHGEVLMTPSSHAIELIVEFEGFRARPYQCSAGVWTIGYGRTHAHGCTAEEGI